MVVLRRDANTGKIAEVKLTTVELAVSRAYENLLDKGFTHAAALSRLSLRSSLTPNFVRFLTGMSDVKAVVV